MEKETILVFKTLKVFYDRSKLPSVSDGSEERYGLVQV
jgi:hypothetical protein